jgi:hypothetical protein
MDGLDAKRNLISICFKTTDVIPECSIMAQRPMEVAPRDSSEVFTLMADEVGGMSSWLRLVDPTAAKYWASVRDRPPCHPFVTMDEDAFFPFRLAGTPARAFGQTSRMASLCWN